MALTQIQVKGRYRNGDSTTPTGKVTITPTNPFRDQAGHIAVPAVPRVFPLDNAGEFVTVLYATDDTTTQPVGATYTVVEEINYGGAKAQPYTYRVAISKDQPGGSVWLDEITPTTTVAGFSYATTAELHAIESQYYPQGYGATPLGQPELTAVYAAIKAGCARFAVLGDSILQLSAWEKLLGMWFASRYNDHRASDQMIHCNTGGSYGWSTLGGTVINEVGASGYLCELDAGQFIAHITDNPCDRLSFFYSKGPTYTGTVLVKCDGVTVDSFSTAAATLSRSNLYTLPAAQSLAVHTWRLEAQGGRIGVEDSFFHAGTSLTSGTTVWGFAHPGYAAATYLTAASTVTAIGNLRPHCVVIALATNDATESIVPDLTALVAAIRAAVPGVAVVLAVPYVGATALAGDIELVRALAASLGCAIIDFQEALGSLASPNDPYDLSIDSVHPSSSGNQALGDAATMALTGAPLDTLISLLTQIRSEVRSYAFTTPTGDGGSVSISSDSTFGTPVVKVTAGTTKTATLIPGNLRLEPFTSGTVEVGGPGFGLPAAAFRSTVTDTQFELILAGSGIAALLGLGPGLFLGPGGSAPVDTNVWRSGAGQLKTNAQIQTAGRARGVASKTGNYTVATGDEVVLCSTAGGGFTITLPSASTLAGRSIWIKKTSTDGNTLTVATAGGTIDGAATKAWATATRDGYQFTSDGTNWLITSKATT